MKKVSKKKRKKTNIEFGMELYERIQRYSNITEETPEESISRFYDRYFPYMDSLKYLIMKLPYSIRLYIVDYISVISSRFMINVDDSDNRVRIYSYEKRVFVKVKQYIRLMYGYFSQDFTRKPYLIFGYLVFRLGIPTLMYIPQNQLRQVYLLEGVVEDYSSLPDQLQSLCLCKVKIKKSVFLPLLKRLRRLRKFAVKEIEGLNDIEIMEELTKVRVIRIMECNLTSKCCEILCKSKNIVILNLCENKNITSCGLEPMRYNKTATLLSLDDSSVDDTCTYYLEDNRTIHQVEFNGTALSSVGLLKLLSHPTIRWIEAGNINYRPFTKTEYREIMETKEAKKNCLSLEKLIMDISTIPKALFQIFRKFLKNLTFLSLCNSHLRDDDIKTILKFKSLTGIAVSYNSLLTMDSVCAISENQKLTKVEYCQDALGNQEAVELFRSTNIKTLWIEGRHLTNKCLLELPNNHILEYFIIAGANGIDEFGIEFVKNACISIKELRYTNSPDDESEARSVKTWFRD